jgi:hypothetical protein
VVVFGVGLEVTRQLIDTSGKQGDLNFRGSGVVLGALVIGDDFRLVDFSNGHDFP